MITLILRSDDTGPMKINLKSHIGLTEKVETYMGFVPFITLFKSNLVYEKEMTTFFSAGSVSVADPVKN